MELSASLYVGVPMVDKIAFKDGKPYVAILSTVAESYKNPGLEPEGLKFLFCSIGIFFFVSKILKKICYSIFHMDKVI